MLSWQQVVGPLPVVSGLTDAASLCSPPSSRQTADDCRTLFMYMSPALRAEATCYMHAKAISSMALFRRLPEDMLIEMALALRSEIYTPHEVGPPSALQGRWWW
jgi:hypothetical protein